jgi:hypothetical protein
MKRIAQVALVSAFLVSLEHVLRAEELVLVPPGTYTMAEVLTRGGTSANWVRYKPLNGNVTIRGGGSVDKPFVILDGFVFDGNLHPRAPKQTGALNVAASNVRIENSEIRGPKDIHTGFNANDQPSCGESDGFPNRGGGMSAEGQNVVFDNVVIHGFYSAGTFLKGSTVQVTNSLIRNNFNGLSFQGAHTEIRDSVFWVNPNHLNNANTPSGAVHFINNLIVDAQEVNMIWCADCVSELAFIHNTIYIPANRRCGEMQGIKTAMVRDRVLVRDNIVVNTSSPYVGSAPETQSMTSNFNLFYQHTRGNDEFRYGPRNGSKNRVSRMEWLRLGRDSESIFDVLPGFEDPPQYEDFSANRWGFRIPTSAAEARSWFFLRKGSPGTGAASDKSDIGISRTPVRGPTGRTAIPRTRPSAPQGLTLD